MRVVTGYDWLPLFRSQIGYRLPLVTKFDDLDRLPLVPTIGYRITAPADPWMVHQ